MTFDRRVVVTGMGVVSPVGTGIKDAWASLIDGRSGIGPLTHFDATDYPVRIAGQVDDFDPAAIFGKRRAKHLDRFAQFGLVAAAEAVEHSGLDMGAEDAHRVGVVFASGIGGMGTFEREVRTLVERGPEWVNPYFCPMMIPNMAAGEIAMAIGAMGHNSCTVTACAASAHALGEGYDTIRLGRADTMVCGGAEAGLVPIGIAGFAAMKALSTRNDEPERASRPFDAGRDGFVAAEGAACLVLEERGHALARGAPCWPSWWASGHPAMPTTRPPPTLGARAPSPPCEGRCTKPALPRLRSATSTPTAPRPHPTTAWRRWPSKPSWATACRCRRPSP